MRIGILLFIAFQGAFGVTVPVDADQTPAPSHSVIQNRLHNIETHLDALVDERIEQALTRIDGKAGWMLDLAQMVLVLFGALTVIFLALFGLLTWRGERLEQRAKAGVEAIENHVKTCEEKINNLEKQTTELINKRAQEIVDDLKSYVEQAKIELEGIRQDREELLEQIQRVKHAKLGEKVDAATEDAAKKVKTATRVDMPDRLIAMAILEEMEGNWQEALALWKAIAAVQADNSRALFGIAYCSGQLADKESDPKKKYALLEEVCRKYEEAVKRDDTDAMAWSNWGAVLGRLADLAESQEQKRALLEKACHKYKEAVKRDDTHAVAWSNWGTVLGRLADLAETQEQKGTLLEEACCKCEEAVKRDDTLANAWFNWGVALEKLVALEQNATAKRHLLQDAGEKFLRAHELEPGKGCYGLAHIAALQGDAAACKNWLLKAEELDRLPSAEHIEKDPDLDAVRETSWFQELLARQRKREQDDP